jgi:Putative MetA-pathway of phenol degradation
VTVMTRTLGILCVIVLSAPVADAQTLRGAVTALMTNEGVQTGDFQRDQAAAEAAADTIQRSLLVNLTSAPIATSSGGFLYRLNPRLGTVERASESFGTFFVERALTAGAGCVSFGFTTSTVAFTRLNGFRIDDGSLVTVANKFRDETLPFDTESLDMHLRASSVTLLANVGVTDQLDIGVAVPIARVGLEGERQNVYRGNAFVQTTATGSASGLADIALRAKYSVFSSRSGGVAAAGEVRLPTGDEENLLGAGSLSWRLMGVGSIENGPVGLHINAGIVRGGVSNETLISGAVAVAVHPRVTVTGEFLSRNVSELHGFVFATAPHPSVAGVDTIRLTSDELSTNLFSAIAGLKWNISDTLVLGAHVLFPVVDRGLTSWITPAIALEYSVR